MNQSTETHLRIRIVELEHHVVQLASMLEEHISERIDECRSCYLTIAEARVALKDNAATEWED